MSLFSKIQIWGLGVKKIFFLQFLVDILPPDPDPEAKILRIQRIRILSTG